MSKSKTVFVSAEVPLWGDLSFFVDGNSKITAENGTMEEPVPNAFSLPHVSTCPGATPSCLTSCYVSGLKQNSPETYAKYVGNERVMHRVLMSDHMADAAAAMLASWIRTNVESFRWHVSGDVFSHRHAAWIATVCRLAPDVRFWIYTRNFYVLDVLSPVANLALNVSADESNLQDALVAARRSGARVCYMSSNGELPVLPEGSVIFPDYPLRGRDLDDPTQAPWWQGLSQVQRRMVCPADFFGQSEQTRCGPCKKCLVPA